MTILQILGLRTHLQVTLEGVASFSGRGAQRGVVDDRGVHSADGDGR